jgi:hypothetical protein
MCRWHVAAKLGIMATGTLGFLLFLGMDAKGSSAGYWGIFVLSQDAKWRF